MSAKPAMRQHANSSTDSAAQQEAKFRLDGRRVPGARWVAVVGSFNGWGACAHKLTLGQDGWWSLTVPLSRGTHTYLFIVDGHPYNDPNDDGRAPCEWGGWYSVRVVR